MPELPEVETVCKGLKNYLQGCEIQDIALNTNKLRYEIEPNFVNNIKNKKILDVFRIAKYIIIVLEDVHWIIHLGMSGYINFCKKDDYIQSKHDHIVWQVNDKIFSFNDVRKFGYTFTCNNYKENNVFKTLAKEPFDFKDLEFFNKIVKNKRPLKNVLLDQQIIAGLGNIYVLESLWLSKLSPFKISNTITIDQSKLLLQNIVKILNIAIEHGGSSLKDYQKIDGSKGNFQNYFNVYQQHGKQCKNINCNGIIQKAKQSGRSSFYCNTCQVL